MANSGKSGSLIPILIIGLLIGLVGGLEFFLVGKYPVVPITVIKDPLVEEYVHPDIDREILFGGGNDYKLSAEFFDREDVSPLLDKYREFDKDRGMVSVKDEFGMWGAYLIALNLLLFLPAIYAGLNFAWVGVVITSVVAAATAAVPWMIYHSGNLTSQLYFLTLTVKSRSSFEEMEILGREIFSYLDGLLNSMKTIIQMEAVVIIVLGLAVKFMYERASNTVMRELEDKSNTIQSMQAQMFNLQNAAEDLQKLDKKFFKLTSRLTNLQSFTQQVGKTLIVDEVCQKVLEVIVKVIGAEKCCIYLFDDATKELTAVRHYGWTADEEKDKKIVNKEDKGNINRALETERIQSTSVDEDNSAAKRAFSIGNTNEIPSVMCAPLLLGEKKLGVLNIEKMDGNPDQDEIRLFYYISTLTAMALENSKLFQKTEELANFDGLTKLYTHRYMQDFLDRKIEESGRYKHPLSIILTDIDHFKKFNDDYGHQTGDMLLAETANVLKECVRNVDLAARYGGEEFLAILPETDYKGAYAFAERLRRETESRSYYDEKSGKNLKVTISVGIAQFPLHDTVKSQLIEKADAALYTAKETGRNRVCIAKVSKEALQKLKDKE